MFDSGLFHKLLYIVQSILPTLYLKNKITLRGGHTGEYAIHMLVIGHLED